MSLIQTWFFTSRTLAPRRKGAHCCPRLTSMKPGEDYFDTHSSADKSMTIRILLSLDTCSQNASIPKCSKPCITISSTDGFPVGTAVHHTLYFAAKCTSPSVGYPLPSPVINTCSPTSPSICCEKKSVLPRAGYPIINPTTLCILPQKVRCPEWAIHCRPP
jgi:hypothetical protein